jgi:hypothetical protein
MSIPTILSRLLLPFESPKHDLPALLSHLVDVYAIIKLGNYPHNAEHPQRDKKDLQQAEGRYKHREKYSNTNYKQQQACLAVKSTRLNSGLLNPGWRAVRRGRSP